MPRSSWCVRGMSRRPVRGGCRHAPGLGVHRRRRAGVAELGPGDYFGEIGLLRKAPRVATVRATTPLRLYRIPGQEFLEILSQGAVRSRTLTRTAQSRLAEFLEPGTVIA